MRARVRVRGYGELNACGGKAKREEKRKKRENKREGSRSNSEERKKKGEEIREKTEERREEKEEREQKRGEIFSSFSSHAQEMCSISAPEKPKKDIQHLQNTTPHLRKTSLADTICQNNIISKHTTPKCCCYP